MPDKLDDLPADKGGRDATDRLPAGENWIEHVEKRTEANIDADRAAIAILRDTAKWIVGGVAVAAGGVIAGSALTSLGSLGLEPRLLVAFCAAVLGFAALASLLWIAIDVLAPRTYEIHALLRGETIATRDLAPILSRFRRPCLSACLSFETWHAFTNRP